MRFSGLFFIGILMLSSCANQTERSLSSVQEEALISRARNASQTLMSTLQTQLKLAIQNEGAVGAVKTCSVISPAIARKVGEESGLQIQRVSFKNRNPQGKPDAFESEQLHKWAKEQASLSAQVKDQAAYEVVKENDKLHFRYMQPIRIQQACLQCHGQSVTPQVKNAIQENYPEDLATGYALNDLRGAVSVKIEVSPEM